MPAISRNFMPLGATGQGSHDEVIWRQDASLDDGSHRPVRSFECSARPLSAPPAIRSGTQPIDGGCIISNITLHGGFPRQRGGLDRLAFPEPAIGCKAEMKRSSRQDRSD